MANFTFLFFLHSQGTLGRCPPPILFGLTYVAVLEKLSETYFFLHAQNRFEGVITTPKSVIPNTHLIDSHTTVIKLKGEFCYKMKNLYLFIQINFIPIKVIPSRYNALMPTFFPIVETLVKFDFRNCLQSLLRFGLYLFNRVKAVSLDWSFEFEE